MSEAYKQAGVDLQAGYEAVHRMKKHVEKTCRKGVMQSIGSFGGMFDLSILNYKEPVLISGTDGVGTKLQLAFIMDRHDTIGIDAVAMCVNDIVVQGADPLFFLDYIAVGKADPIKIEHIVSGVATGCKEANLALIGGETAEMPGLYDEHEYDIAGFAVGVCEKSDVLSGSDVQSGDILIGLASSGVHSNGFSLVRKIISDKGLDYKEIYEPFNQPLGEVLLTPTKIYVESMLALKKNNLIKGAAHITGGGFYENIPRMLSDDLGAVIDVTTFPMLDVFQFLHERGKLSLKEMYNVFNMGIGMVVAVDENRVNEALEIVKASGDKAYVIGEVNRTGQLQLNGVTE